MRRPKRVICPTLTTDPSAGYWKDWTSAVVDVGHSRSPSATVSWPGIVMRRRNALAPVLALRGGGAAEAIAANTSHGNDDRDGKADHGGSG